MAGAELKPQTVQAFDAYSRRVESRVEELLRAPAFLWSDQSPERSRRVREGQVLAESLTGKEPVSVPNGIIHDWVGATFIPGGSIDRVMTLVQDYDHHKNVYQP